MIRSHYIPQFILRAFYEDDKIQYMDLASKRIEHRNSKSVFSEDGYYPEQLEHDLCDKIERDFASVHKKILESSGKFTLSAAEMFLLKKFLLVSIIRYKEPLSKEDQAILEDYSESERETLFGNFFDNINKILKCKTKDEITNFYDYQHADTNLHLTAYAKDILGSYLIFVTSKDCGREFLISDKGYSWYMGQLAMEKVFILAEDVQKRLDPLLIQTLTQLTPHDYTIFPLSKNIAVVNMSPFYKFLADNSRYTISKDQIQGTLGFGNGNILRQARVSFDRNNKPIDYGFEVKPLCGRDVEFLNRLLMQNAESHIAFANKGKLGIDL